MPQAKQTFLMKANPQGSPSERSEDGNPVYNPNNKHLTQAFGGQYDPANYGQGYRLSQSRRLNM